MANTYAAMRDIQKVLLQVKPIPARVFAADWVRRAHDEENQMRSKAKKPSLSWEQFTSAMLDEDRRKKLLIGDKRFRDAFAAITSRV